jgi:hypothetical protein
MLSSAVPAQKSEALEKLTAKSNLPTNSSTLPSRCRFEEADTDAPMSPSDHQRQIDNLRGTAASPEIAGKMLRCREPTRSGILPIDKNARDLRPI